MCVSASHYDLIPLSTSDVAKILERFDTTFTGQDPRLIDRPLQVGEV
jgi:hypothetical protein